MEIPGTESVCSSSLQFEDQSFKLFFLNSVSVVNEKRHAKRGWMFVWIVTTETRPRGYKFFFMLNSVEHAILNAHKYKNIKKFGFY